jgi:hypothetical protein
MEIGPQIGGINCRSEIINLPYPVARAALFAYLKKAAIGFESKDDNGGTSVLYWLGEITGRDLGRVWLLEKITGQTEMIVDEPPYLLDLVPNGVSTGPLSFEEQEKIMFGDIPFVELDHRQAKAKQELIINNFLKSIEDEIATTINLNAQQASIKEPPPPPEPPNRTAGGNIELWFAWYHAMLDGGYKCKLEIVAEKSGYSHGYIKQKHAIYQSKPNLKT